MRTGLFLVILAAGCGSAEPDLWQSLQGAKGDGFSRSVSDDKIDAAIRLWDGAESGAFEGTKGVQLNYKVFPAPNERGRLVIVNGRTESHAKYAELLLDLQGQGLTLYVYDHRGQGLSQRLLDDPRKGHVETYSDYVKDLDLFIKKIDEMNPSGTPRYALSHSMGGAILTLYLLRHPETFSAVAHSSPMYKIKLPMVEWASYQFAKTMFAESSAKSDKPRPSFEDNELTRSPERYAMIDRIYKRLEKNGVCPLNTPDGCSGVELGPPTYGWVEQSILADWKIREDPASLSTPMLVMQAKADALVETEAEESVCEKAQNCRLLPFDEAYHEILMEKDSVRSQAIDAMLSFFQAHHP